MTGRRVAITGLGIVAPHGHDPADMMASLMRGESAVDRIVVESPAGSVETLGASVRYGFGDSVPSAQRMTSDRVSMLALEAAHRALVDAGLNLDHEDAESIGVAVGTAQGGTRSEEFAYSEMLKAAKARLSPFTLVKVMYNGPAAQICMRYGIRGPSVTYTTTCSSSSVAIGEAMRSIRHGYSDIMIAGGTEALFSFVSIKAWQALQVMAEAGEGPPARACKPFSLDRTGTVLGEGAAFVVLEEMGRALERGRVPYAELTGYGVTNDPGHLTQPTADGQAQAMRLALQDAKCDPGSIDYINAHGTGTMLNDVTETRAIKTVFREHARRIAVSSTKSMHGHLVGASGALEVVVTTLAVNQQIAPPTAHLANPDPECDLDYVPNLGRRRRIGHALTNSFAVGGTAAVLLISSWRS